VAGANFCRVCGTPLKRPVSQPQPTSRSPERRQPNPRRPTRLTIWGLAGGSVLVLVGVLMLFKASGPGSTAGPRPAAHDEQRIPYPEVPRMPLAEAKARFEAETAIFVDVRSPSDYEAAHIPRAVSLPLTDLAARYQALPREAEILAYCT
jgi:3-mercaptopyruvate sulfurtransferase SseA